MYQARRWNEDPLYQAVMTVHGPGQEYIFIHDFVIYRHKIGGSTLCRIEKIFVDVSLTETVSMLTLVLLYTHREGTAVYMLL